MKRIALVVSVLFAVGSFGCGSDDSSGSGGSSGSSGSGGSSGSTGGSAGAATGGAGGNGGASGGGAGGAGSGDCPTCLACVQSACGTEITTCEADTECKAIYDCVKACGQKTPDQCIADHQGGVTIWAGVSQCLNDNCLSSCQ
ncbi:MAG: hypothetical protein KC776_16060 [Myxococcales bacterium]|nr:hypothetical protein [Myxococcales bacterium]MCB9579556.1 hypothetical protein [Polyangiaceae bacterium]